MDEIILVQHLFILFSFDIDLSQHIDLWLDLKLKQRLCTYINWFYLGKKPRIYGQRRILLILVMFVALINTLHMSRTANSFHYYLRFLNLALSENIRLILLSSGSIIFLALVFVADV